MTYCLNREAIFIIHSPSRRKRPPARQAPYLLCRLEEFQDDSMDLVVVCVTITPALAADEAEEASDK